MDTRRFQVINGSLVRTPLVGFWQANDGGGLDPSVPNLSLEDPVSASAGVAIITLAGATLSGGGVIALAGALAVTLADAALSSAGALGSPIEGSASITLAPVTASAGGALALAGTASVSLAAVTLEASGNFGSALTGALSVTLGDASLSATATLVDAPAAPPHPLYGFLPIPRRRAFVAKDEEAVVYRGISAQVEGRAIVRGRIEAVADLGALAAGYTATRLREAETVVSIGLAARGASVAAPLSPYLIVERREWALGDDEIAALLLAA